MSDHRIPAPNAATTSAARTQLEPSSGWGAQTPSAAPPGVADGIHPYDRLLRLPEVLRLCALGRSTLYEKIARGLFPKQVRLGENIVAWYESEIRAWIRNPT